MATLYRNDYPDKSPSEIGQGLHDKTIRICPLAEQWRIDLDSMFEGMLQRNVDMADRSVDPKRRCLSILRLGADANGLPVAVIDVHDEKTAAVETVHVCTYCNMAGMCGNPIVNRNLRDLLGDDPVWNWVDEDEDDDDDD